MLKFLLVASVLFFLTACALIEEMNKPLVPPQTRSVCDALVEQFEKATSAEHLDKASKLYQKHKCA